MGRDPSANAPAQARFAARARICLRRHGARCWLTAGYVAAWLALGGYLMTVAWDYLRAPTGEQWAPVIALLDANAQPDEAVLFEPAWVFGYATDLGKLRRFSPFASLDQALAGTQVGGLWLISPFSPPVIPGEARARFPAEQRLRAGRYHVAYLGAAARALRAPAYLGLAQARAWVQHEDRTVEAEWDGAALAYPDLPPLHAEYLRVRLRQDSFDGEAHLGVLLHPAARGGHSLELSALRLTPRLLIEGGLPDRVVRPGRSDVQLRVFVGDELASTLSFANQRGWRRHVVDTSRWSGSRARVRFVASAAGGNHSRHFHFTFATAP